MSDLTYLKPGTTWCVMDTVYFRADRAPSPWIRLNFGDVVIIVSNDGDRPTVLAPDGTVGFMNRYDRLRRVW